MNLSHHFAIACKRRHLGGSDTSGNHTDGHRALCDLGNAASLHPLFSGFFTLFLILYHHRTNGGLENVLPFAIRLFLVYARTAIKFNSLDIDLAVILVTAVLVVIRILIVHPSPSWLSQYLQHTNLVTNMIIAEKQS